MKRIFLGCILSISLSAVGPFAGGNTHGPEDGVELPAPIFRAIAVDLGDRDSTAYDLNDDGWIAGSATIGGAQGLSVATLWRPDGDRWVAQTVARRAGVEGRAAAVNNRGEVAVLEDGIFRWSEEEGFFEFEGPVWHRDSFQRMNDDGWVLTSQEVLDRDGNRRRYIYSIAPLGGGFTDFAQNGEIVVGGGTFFGVCEFARYQTLAFYDDQAVWIGDPCEFTHARFTAVNDVGEAVARGAHYSQDDDSWTILSPEVAMHGINNRSEMIGDQGQVWLDFQSYHISNLLVNPEEFSDIELVAINENSQIAANGVDASGRRRALLIDSLFHPADTDRDWSISLREVTAYGAIWRTADVRLSFLTRAGHLWRSGGPYRYDPDRGEKPAAWVRN